MFVDSIAEALVGLIELAARAVFALINLLAVVIERIGRCFVSGFSVKRVRMGVNEGDANMARQAIVLLIVVFLVMVLFGAMAVSTLMERDLRVVDQRGEPAVLVELEIDRGGEKERHHTDLDGLVRVPRFGVTSISLESKRFQNRTWPGHEIGPVLVVEKTHLGTTLDKLKTGLFGEE